MIFQPITEDLLDIVLEIINSNENGVPSRTIEEVKNEL